MRGVTILQGDALEVLKTLPDESVHCVVTSPPYWGLRDYGIVGQLGLETSPWEYMGKMVDVFSEVRRVLRADGTAWVNMGDCYATGAGAVGDCPGGGERGARWKGEVTRYRDEKRRAHGQPEVNGRGESQRHYAGKGPRRQIPSHVGKNTAIVAVGPMTQPNRMPIEGLKPKDLVGMPWRLALELQADGWYLRSDIIWHKPNPMPESVRDRPTKSHEYIFLLSKSEKYFYDAEAIAEDCIAGNNGSSFTSPQDVATKPNLGTGPRADRRPRAWDRDMGSNRTLIAGYARANGKWSKEDSQSSGRRIVENVKAARAAGADHDSPFGTTRNKRTVWSVHTAPFPDAHFATFPEELIKPCILAGCPAGGTVLDPFFGAGTTAVVARANGCKCIGIEINPEYIEIAKRRLRQDVLDFAEVAP